MIKQKYGIVLSLVLIFLLNGCGVRLLPTTLHKNRTPWESFDKAKRAFDKVVIDETDLKGLKTLGFDPFSSANMEIHTYLDIMARFMPNPAIKKEDLDRGVRECIDSQNNCVAYEMVVEVSRTERKGNVFLDLFGFKRKTCSSGWQFHSFFVINNGFVVYKLWGGKPQINETSIKKKPLGPIQESGDVLVGAAKTLL